MKTENLKNRTQSYIQLGLVIGIAIFLNILGNFFYTKIDLTEEKRFTLTKATRQMLAELDDPITVRVLFDGDFPAGVKRLQTGVRELLDDFRSETGYIEYVFEDPYDGPTEEVNKLIEELKKDGMTPVNLRFVDVDGTREVFGYPYAVFYYGGRMLPVDFLENAVGVHPEENLNNSISLLEYKFASAIDKLKYVKKPNIIFTAGHGELEEPQLLDLINTLGPFYNTGIVNLDSTYYIPADEIAAVVVAKPRAQFPEKHKFVLDQYLMNGGKLLWLIDPLNVNLDSMRMNAQYVPFDYPLNIEDMLFKYGARVNSNLVLDLQCSRIPQVIDNQGSIDLFKWFYHPVITPTSSHPIVKGLDNVNLFFPASIDTVRTKNPIKKTVLLTSSQYSRVQFSPVRLDFEILRYDPIPEKFNKPNQPVAVLLEGQFSSLYENRVTESLLGTWEELGQTFQPEGVPAKMMVVSDGDIARNLFNPERGTIRPLGFNKYENRLYANKPFLINALEYLIDDSGIIEARGKEVKLRLLNVVKAKSEKTKWQLINIGLPLVFLMIFGFSFNWLRKRRYTR